MLEAIFAWQYWPIVRAGVMLALTILALMALCVHMLGNFRGD